MLNPVNVLKRGYSITRFKGKAILDPNEIKQGDRVTTELLKGTIESEVT